MKIYILREECWDWTETLGVYSESGKERMFQEYIAQAKVKRHEEILTRTLELNKLREQRRTLCIKDQNEDVPIQQALKASGDGIALKAFRKQRKVNLKEIERITSKVWYEEFEISKLEKLDDNGLFTKYFPHLEFQEHDVLD